MVTLCKYEHGKILPIIVCTIVQVVLLKVVCRTHFHKYITDHKYHWQFLRHHGIKELP